MGSPGLRFFLMSSHPEVRVSKSEQSGAPGRGEPDFERVVIKVSYQVTYETEVPISAYPDMTVNEAMAYEYGRDVPDIIESINAASEDDNSRLDVRAHITWKLT